jgi:hypothetical protein
MESHHGDQQGKKNVVTSAMSVDVLQEIHDRRGRRTLLLVLSANSTMKGYMIVFFLQICGG